MQPERAENPFWWKETEWVEEIRVRFTVSFSKNKKLECIAFPKKKELILFPQSSQKLNKWMNDSLFLSLYYECCYLWSKIIFVLCPQILIDFFDFLILFFHQWLIFFLETYAKLMLQIMGLLTWRRIINFIFLNLHPYEFFILIIRIINHFWLHFA